MKKTKYMILFFMILITSFVNVDAKEVYYTNGNIELTEKEYNFVKDFYGEEYLKNMTFDDYKWLQQMHVNENEVEIKHNYDNAIIPYGSSVSTGEKKLSIAKSCQSTYCTITLLATWLSSPTVRSYDVIGARFSGTSLYNSSITTRSKSSTETVTGSSFQGFYNGFGSSIKLPSNGNNVMVEQVYRVKPGGKIYGSYQHARKNVTLTTSKMYFISTTGYGNVFTFTGAAANCYDGFAGVDISV